MANRIYIICRSSRQISYGEIVDQIGDMGFLDKPARFAPPADERNQSNADWGAFEVHYREDAEPITVEQIRAPAELRTVVGELRDKLEDEPASPIRATLLERFAAAEQALMFELPEELPEDVWEMLDATEGYFAEICDGVIVAHEGVFDANLKQVLAWSRPGI